MSRWMDVDDAKKFIKEVYATRDIVGDTWRVPKGSGIKTQSAFKDWSKNGVHSGWSCDMPTTIPTVPKRTDGYKITVGELIGSPNRPPHAARAPGARKKAPRARPSKRRRPEILDYEMAKMYLHSFVVPRPRNRVKYFNWVRTNGPSFISRAPAHAYKKTGWKGWADYLGNTPGLERPPDPPGSNGDVPFELPGELDPSLIFDAFDADSVLTERPPGSSNGDVPFELPGELDPSADFDADSALTDLLSRVGPPRKKPSRWMPFSAGLEYARALGLKSQKHWKQWAKSGARPLDVPFSPDQVYAESGWKGWRHWLGTDEDVLAYQAVEGINSMPSNPGGGKALWLAFSDLCIN